MQKPMPPQDDDDLIRLLRAAGQGDRRAFKALYDRTSPLLFAIVLRILRNRATAEEVLQDSYLRIWRNAATFSAGTGSPLGWMAAIARNRAIDVVRQRREVLVQPDEDGRDWLESIPDPRAEGAGFVALRQLGHCLGLLDDSHRHCVLLAYYEGYSREELAARFDRPVNTIKTWLHRGLATLRHCMDGAAP
ncbi:sigma-70 family RNA polymerase sigma factor [Inquilinus sp.]|jgi:RNA polymerase sigma factor (sigma-70 family)|uniref:sigma-70 family RNA polymerase sigma factor n=1 Tax=Inquilinus sp. TaxID=1932117 RepID=UPI00378490AA